ncbi:hypothetical protein FBU59_004851 [Linderina macrospora]|uniref:Uncharacterized protein n=1 Tax=Linderina macrospora TaxID=4868 RepID=A0ACC1J4E7_9FUNG|nr:hypothetical protein FBU59_004851 [Linderina macrospora]
MRMLNSSRVRRTLHVVVAIARVRGRLHSHRMRTRRPCIGRNPWNGAVRVLQAADPEPKQGIGCDLEPRARREKYA